MKKLVIGLIFFSFFAPTTVVFAEAGQTPATYGGAVDTTSPDYCAQNGLMYSSTGGTNGAGGCITAPSVVNVNLTYTPLEPIPGLNQTGNAQFGPLLAQLFKVLIILGALIAVGAFVFAGVTYMVSEAVGKIEDAKRRLTSALVGLMLLIGSWIILYTINPQLISFNGGLNPTSPYQLTNNNQQPTQSPETPTITTRGGTIAPSLVTSNIEAILQNARDNPTDKAAQAAAVNARQLMQSTCVNTYGGTVAPVTTNCNTSSANYLIEGKNFSSCATMPTVRGNSEACYYNQ